MQIVEIDHSKVIHIMQTFDQANVENDPLYKGFRAGIQTTLDMLGIRIDGVNWYPDQESDESE